MVPNLNIPEEGLPRIVVIGAGFAGINLVKNLSYDKYQVVLLDRNNYHTFQPLLYQVATAGLEPDSIAYSIRSLFENRPHFHFRIATVKELDPKEKLIHTDLGTLTYDKLVIAIGSTTNYHGNTEIAEHAFSMKSVVEALDIRHVALQNFEQALLSNDEAERERLMSFVIVGGGPTGVELAGALAELKNHVLANDYPDLDVGKMRVHLIQSNECLLPGFTDTASQKVKDYLQEMGVNVSLNTRVEHYDGEQAVTENQTFETKTLIWAAGVKGRQLAGLPDESSDHSRYVVDGFCRIRGVEDIYALGDVAMMPQKEWPHGHPMVAQPAIQQGAFLAKTLNKLAHGEAPTEAFTYKNKGSMATIGRNKAVVNIGDRTITGFMAWLLWMFVHLFSLIGFRNRAVALVNWIIQYYQYNKGVRLILRPYKRPHLPLKEDCEAKRD